MPTQSSNVCAFYGGRSVLVTGATGFVGKALVEKLLRSCPEVRAVYCLVRPKHGKDVASRFREYTKNPVFNAIRSADAAVLEKLRPVAGDVQKAALGLSEPDLQTLRREVSVVFHSAATVRFNEPLALAVEMNTLGTRRVIQLCKQLPNLEAFVHTSTAYSNADKRVVDEMVYEPQVDPDTLINFVKNMPEQVLDAIEPKLIGGHPNTYTFTKNLAEYLVLKEATEIPTAIVRPSIVTAAIQEPQVGWIDNTAGITGIVMEVSRGAIRSIYSDKKMTVDIVPVDIVVNTLLLAAVNLTKNTGSNPTVYNCTTGSINPIQWDALNQFTLKAGREMPSKYVQWYPNCTFRINYLMHRVVQFFLQLLPAYALDVLLKVKGLKPMMVKLSDRTMRACKAGEFFATNQWKFGVEHMETLSSHLSIIDSKKFPVNIKSIKWEEYVKDYVAGIRQFILKDDLSSLGAAKQRLSKLYWGQRIVQFCAILMFMAAVLR